MLAATACAATRSSAARLAETPSTAITLSGPRARAASASSTEESTPPEKATPSRRVLASAANKPATASWSPARNDVNGICVPPAPWDGSLTLCGRSTTNQPGPARHPERLASCLDIAAQAKAGEFEAAQQTARSITDPYAQARALVGLVIALARSGEFEAAQQTARSITDPYAQADALVGLVVVLAEAGAFEAAEQTARAITNPSAVVRAWTQLATTLAKAGNHRWARLLAEAAEQTADTITGDMGCPWTTQLPVRRQIDGVRPPLSLIHISEPTRRTPISY